MGFFEDAGKKISTTLNTTSSKAKDYTEKRKLETSIRSIEDSKKSYFTKIGEITYRANNAGEEMPDISDILDIIRDLDREIEEKKEQIQALNDRIVCPSCGKMMPKEAKFCPYCGAVPEEIQKAPNEETANAETKEGSAASDGAASSNPAKMKLCPSCGHTTDVENRLCPNCGEKISE